MRKINKEQYKRDVLRILKRVKTPVWISSLSSVYNLPCAYLNEVLSERPTTEGLRELIDEKKIIPFVSSNCRFRSKIRIRIALANVETTFNRMAKEKEAKYNFNKNRIKEYPRGITLS